MIKRITSSKGIVTAVWVLGLIVIWEICAFIVGATQRTPVNVLPHLYQIIGSFFDTKSITGSGDTITTLVFSSAAETLSRALIGFIIGMVLGYVLALLMHMSNIVEKIAFPYLMIIQMIPILGMTKMYSLEAIRLISKSLIPAVLDGRNEQAREDMLFAALYAGIAICSAPTALVHSMSRPLGAWFHIPHGLANAMLLSSVMEYNRPSCPEKFRDIAIAMGENVGGLSVREASIAAVEAIAAIADETGLPKLLSSQGVTEDKIPTLAKDAFAAGSTANNPRVPTVEEIETIYKSIF